jgi:hypothetical protein
MDDGADPTYQFLQDRTTEETGTYGARREPTACPP